MEIRSPKRWIYGWSGIFTPVVGSCLSHYIDVYLPCGVWVVWSVGGPWKPPLASTQSCPSSLGRLTQVHCPDSKSQLPGGLQAPSLTEISSNLTVDFVPGPWTAWNTTWWMTWNASWKVASQKWLKNTVCSLVTHCEWDRFVWQRVWGRGSLFKKKKKKNSLRGILQGRTQWPLQPPSLKRALQIEAKVHQSAPRSAAHARQGC